MKSILGGLALTGLVLAAGCTSGPPPGPPPGYNGGPPPGRPGAHYHNRRWIPGHFVYHYNGTRTWVPGHFNYWNYY